MPKTLSLSLALALTPFVSLVGCSTSAPTQVLTGQLAAGFPTQVTQVRAVASGAVVASATVAGDGSFSLAVPPETSVAIELVGASSTRLVFPRHGGAIDATFAIREGGGAFDLGTVRFIGAAASQSFAFHDGSAAGQDCDDGKDATGATCVDDDDNGDGSACDGEHRGRGSDAGSGSDGGSDDGDAVCEHNFPADGCADDGDGGHHDGSDDGSDDGGSAHGSDGSDGSGSDT